MKARAASVLALTVLELFVYMFTKSSKSSKSSKVVTFRWEGVPFHWR